MNHLASTTRHAPNQNGLLAALPKADYERLSGSLELVPLPLGRAVYESGRQLDYVYFLGHGGTLEVESSDMDGGTIFTARLPRIEAAQGLGAPPP